MRLDVAYSPTHDALEIEGFATAVYMLLRLRPGALLYAGLPCASYTWMSSSRHCRSAECPEGDTTKDWVRKHNCLGYRLGLLVLLGLARRVHIFIEHPKKSCLPHTRWLTNVFAINAPEYLSWQWFIITFWMGVWGSWSPKPSMAISTCSWVSVLQYQGRKMNKSLRKAHGVQNLMKDEHFYILRTIMVGQPCPN